jgi:hypothetical protein
MNHYNYSILSAKSECAALTTAGGKALQLNHFISYM